MNKENLWNLIKQSEHESHGNKFNIENFRSIGGFNSRLATWDPMENSTRFFKSLLFSFASYLDYKIIDEIKKGSKSKGSGINYFLKNILKRELGKPLSIKYYKNQIDIDYLLSVEEMFFLNKCLLKFKNIVEIGSGFGRLPHSIISNYKNIENYLIIDLEWMLKISKEYLKKVLDEKSFSKIKFLSVEEYQDENLKKKLAGYKFDLGINVDSFQEMPTEVADDYLEFISNTCEYFYSKNAIGKYKPSSVNIKLEDDSQYQTALQMGLCKEVIDIYDTDELNEQKIKYFETYCPKNFILKKSEQCFGQYLYYFSALYKKK